MLLRHCCWYGRGLTVYVCVCVCLFVGDDIPGNQRHTRDLYLFLCTFPMALARSSSGVVAICYVLPVLWMTSCFIANLNVRYMLCCLSVCLSVTLVHPRPTQPVEIFGNFFTER